MCIFTFRRKVHFFILAFLVHFSGFFFIDLIQFGYFYSFPGEAVGVRIGSKVTAAPTEAAAPAKVCVLIFILVLIFLAF